MTSPDNAGVFTVTASSGTRYTASFMEPEPLREQYSPGLVQFTFAWAAVAPGGRDAMPDLMERMPEFLVMLRGWFAETLDVPLVQSEQTLAVEAGDSGLTVRYAPAVAAE